jgi:hypothetical protein
MSANTQSCAQYHQPDMFVPDYSLEESKKVDKENQKIKASKQVRFLFHKISELKDREEKTP